MPGSSARRHQAVAGLGDTVTSVTSVDPRPAGQLTVVDAHQADVGGMAVRRSLPRHGRRTVGAWCFADHFGPQPLTGARPGMQVGPHPHIGLQTVTWLLEGEVLHTDSLGSEQPVRPGQLNLMTAGAGIAHAEQSPDLATGRIHGVQLWVAQPEATRHDPPAFEHHPTLPVVDLDHGSATILVGALDGTRSPATAATELLGADLALEPGASPLPLRPDFEHAVLPLDGPVTVDGTPLAVGQAAVVETGADELAVEVDAPGRVLVLGGTPLAEAVLMWWNFVARTRAEIDEARAGWEASDPRFGTVASGLARIGAPPTPWR